MNIIIFATLPVITQTYGRLLCVVRISQQIGDIELVFSMSVVSLLVYKSIWSDPFFTWPCVCLSFRLVAKFNHSHTIGDVRRHIVASRPQYAGANFLLLTTLPSRQLTDDSVSLKDADLLNAAIMQKL